MAAVVRADGCGSGSWIESCASRRATTRVPVTIVGLHCPGKRETGLHGPNRDCAMEPLAPRPEPLPAEKGDGCAGRFPSSHAYSIIPSVPLCFKTHPSSTHSPVRSTQRHRDNRVVMWSSVRAWGQAFAGAPAGPLQLPSASLRQLQRHAVES